MVPSAWVFIMFLYTQLLCDRIQAHVLILVRKQISPVLKENAAKLVLMKMRPEMSGRLLEATISNVAPRATQKRMGPVRSVSFMMLPSAGFIGLSTVKVFCHM